MKINIKILEEIEKLVCDLITKESSENLSYHTINHTRLVVKNAEIIGSKENLDEDEMNILLTSAWFHDTGYIKKYQGHEKESVAIAENFLRLKNVDENTIDLVSECIMATTNPQQPNNKIAEALCDADLMHLGADNYFDLAEELRQEWRNTGIRKLKKFEFDKESEQLFKNHSYFTEKLSFHAC